MRLLVLGMLLATAAPLAMPAQLDPGTAQAFDGYIRQAEARLEKPQPFLWADAAPVRRESIHRGEVLTEPWSGTGEIGVTRGLIHDWVGAVFIPGATIESTLKLLQDYNRHKDIYRPEVIDSQLLGRSGNDFNMYLRLKKKKVLTVVLDTWHEARYSEVDRTRWRSQSRSTRIAEVDDGRELPPGSGHGFLWRLNSYWRFEERDGGVYVECEAISLTRGVPAGLGWLIDPIVRSLPRESLANTLRATRAALAR